MNKRTDRLTATHVDLAVNVAAAFNLAAGVRALHEQGVSPAIVQRVLIDRGPQRGTTSARPEPSSILFKSDFLTTANL
jgi:hypothetical protein